MWCLVEQMYEVTLEAVVLMQMNVLNWGMVDKRLSEMDPETILIWVLSIFIVLIFFVLIEASNILISIHEEILAEGRALWILPNYNISAKYLESFI